MTISLEQVKELRARTGVGVVDAKEALDESKGDVEKAITILREKGKVKAAKKAERETNEGVVASYVHSNNKIAVLVSLVCETDFVARNEKFQELGRNIAMQIAAMDPLVVSPDDGSEEEVAKEKELVEKQLKEDKKPKDIQEKIIKGKLTKFREDRALLKQDFVKEPEKTIEQLIQEAIQELGENISVREFVRLSI